MKPIFYSLSLLIAACTGWLGSACNPAPPPQADKQAEKTEPIEEAPKSPEPEPKPAAEAPPEPSAAPEPTQIAADSPLLKPELATEKAPERYTVVLETTEGDIYIDVRRSWAPLGADRFYNLVKMGYFTDAAFFRVIDGFMAQVGIHGSPEVNRAWRNQRIDDDPVTQSNKRGTLSFATSGPNSRVNQFFVNFGDNSRLDAMGFAPFGRVRNMDVVDKLYAGYGEGAPAGRGPVQALIQSKGNAYLRAEFPELDYIRRAFLVDEKSAPPKQKSNIETPD